MTVLMRCQECAHEEFVDVKGRSLEKVFLLIMLWHCREHRQVSECALDKAFWDGLE